MAQDQVQKALYGPQLLFEEESFKCGYAPRTLVVSKFHPNTVFVGCKDGSITVLRPRPERAGSATAGSLALGDFVARGLGAPAEPGAPGGSPASQGAAGAIRALCELDETQLLVARRDGTLEIVRWDGPAMAPPVRQEHLPDPIRTLVRLDDDHVAVAYRSLGLTVIERESDQPFPPRKVGDAAGGAVQGIRSIFPLRSAEDADRSVWFLLTDRGDLHEWDGDSGRRPNRVEGIWAEGPPSLISDFCLLPDETGRPAAEALVATDRGLYHLFRRDGGELTSRRLALSGLTATPMVLAYTSFRMSDGTSREFL